MQLLRELPVEVTARDIELGVPGNVIFCAIALAVERQYPGAAQYGVSNGELRLRFGDWQVTYQLPEEASAFMKRFDRQNWLRWLFPPRPFSFVAQLADEPWHLSAGHEVVPEVVPEPELATV
jgi:hypothetical protein